MEFKKADLIKRFLASLIDGIVAGMVSLIPMAGWLISIAYMLVKDGLFEGASPGKRLVKLKVKAMDGGSADYMISAKRNAIFAIPNVFMVIPLLGPMLAAPVALIIAVVEIIFVFIDPMGRRLGDKFAGSVVVEE